MTEKSPVRVDPCMRTAHDLGARRPMKGRWYLFFFLDIAFSGGDGNLEVLPRRTTHPLLPNPSTTTATGKTRVTRGSTGSAWAGGRNLGCEMIGTRALRAPHAGDARIPVIGLWGKSVRRSGLFRARKLS
jgi:hypothetical protein